MLDGFEDPPMTYQAKAIRLDGGLDLVTPKSMVQPGSFLNCLNYEFLDEAGPRRIEGFNLFDGAMVLAEEEVYYIRSNSVGTDITGGQGNGKTYLFTTANTTVPFGVLFGKWTVSSTEKYIAYVPINPGYAPIIGSSVVLAPTPSATFTFNSIVALPAKLASYSGASWDTSYGTLSGEALFSPRSMAMYWGKFKASLNEDGYASSNGPYSYLTYGSGFSQNGGTSRCVLGATTFNDVIYSVADQHAGTISSAGSVPQVYPGDRLFINQAPFGDKVGLVTYVNKLTGDWNNVSGVSAEINYLDITNRESSSATNTYYRTPVNSGFNSSATLRLARSPASQYTFAAVTGDPQARASLFRSYTEKQATESQCLAYITLTDNTTVPFTTPPVVTIFGGSGYGATAEAQINAAGTLVSIRVTNPGRGYTSAPVVAVTGGGGTYSGTITAVLMDYRHSGTKEINTGWIVPFSSGNSQSDFLTKVDRNKRATQQAVTYTSTSYTTTPRFVMTGLDYAGAYASGTGPNWATASNPWSDAVQTLSDGAAITWGMRALNFNNSGTSATLGFTNFAGIQNTLPENSVIQGVQVKVYYYTVGNLGTMSTSNIPTLKMRCALMKTSQNTDLAGQRTETRLGNFEEIAIAPFSSDIAPGTTSITFGGSANLWGTSLSYADLIDPRFGVGIDLAITRAGGYAWPDMTWLIDKIEIIVQYQSPIIKYFFTDGAGNTISADLVDYVITGGSFRNRDAKGFLQVANLTQHATTSSTATASHNIRNGWSMYANSGLTALIASVSGDMSYNELDGYDRIVAAESRYQFIQANFYASEDWDGIYGTSGAGRAFQYDGAYFQRIYAYNPSMTDADALDKPRHIAKHRYRLALGYKTGLVDFSVEGEPTKFDGIFGAAEIGVGDRITGFSNAQGTYLYVFGENSVTGIRDADLNTTVVVPNDGAIEYTVCNIGDRTIFTNSRGISSLDQSQKYGDFEGMRLSYAVSKWLLPRLSTVGTSLAETTAYGGVVAAYVVRHKNQYRIWFRDGVQLIMSLVGSDQRPVFTFTKLLFPVPDTGNPNVIYTAGRTTPLALSSTMDSTGKERIFFSLDLLQSVDEQGQSLFANSLIPLTSYLYESDSGWSFSGWGAAGSIPAYFVTNHYYSDDPIRKFTLHKTRVEGEVRGIASCRMSVHHDYNIPTPGNTGSVDFDITDVSGVGMPTEYSANSSMVNISDTGRLINLRVDNYTTADSGGFTAFTDRTFGTLDGTAYPQPPHYLQLMIAQTEPGGEDA